MELTFCSDKLVALSGLSTEKNSVWPDQHLAGLWKRSLLEDLIWSMNRSTYLVEPVPVWQPDFYRAPSWSWASMEGRVFFSTHEGYGSTMQARIIETGTSTTSTNPFGSVSDGFIRIQGDLKEYQLHREPMKGTDDIKLKVNLDCLDPVGICERNPTGLCASKEFEHETGSSVYLLPIMSAGQSWES